MPNPKSPCKNPEGKKLVVKLTKSPLGYNRSQRIVCVSLGLGKMNTVVYHHDTPVIRGMINKVTHLVTVEER